MALWEIFVVVALLFLILEMFVPSMFFLNFAIGAFLSAIGAIYSQDWSLLTLIFALFSLISLVALRPLLVKRVKLSQETGINVKYIGKTAKVIETVNNKSGVITIYDERWLARSEQEIPVGADVEIVKNDSLIMYVKEIK